jgi:hypothetical protein
MPKLSQHLHGCCFENGDREINYVRLRFADPRSKQSAQEICPCERVQPEKSRDEERYGFQA